uniref:Uncharacterized protein LOC111102037 n=1 Tax=Crassostrea virginica TaxID=6565 RepID=A0A8B8AGV0_CRAVI|nr:uncharacterized protein LOC111102037 [Crassostrea virginica]
MAKHREELHKEIDNAMNLWEKKIDENKTKHHDILNKQLEEIKQLQILMQERLNTMDDMEDSNEVSPTIHYSSNNQEFSKLPPKVQEIWTNGDTDDIKCFNTQGVLQKTIQTKSYIEPNDIAVSSDGALVYSDGSTRTVYKVKNDQTEEIICLDEGWTPVGRWASLCSFSMSMGMPIMFVSNLSVRPVLGFEVQVFVSDITGFPHHESLMFEHFDRPVVDQIILQRVPTPTHPHHQVTILQELKEENNSHVNK